MKAAPEKIYINPKLENRTWLIGKGDISFIEYIRTDAFIEKVAEWLRKNSNKYNGKVQTIVGTLKVVDSENLINDFKEAMKL